MTDQTATAAPVAESILARAKAIDPGAWSLNGSRDRRELAVHQAEREAGLDPWQSGAMRPYQYTLEVDQHQGDDYVSPTPWRFNEGWDVAWKHESPILDGNGDPIFESSEWLCVTRSNIDLIIRAVNELGEDSEKKAIEDAQNGK